MVEQVQELSSRLAQIEQAYAIAQGEIERLKQALAEAQVLVSRLQA